MPDLTLHRNVAKMFAATSTMQYMQMDAPEGTIRRTGRDATGAPNTTNIIIHFGFEVQAGGSNAGQRRPVVPTASGVVHGSVPAAELGYAAGEQKFVLEPGMSIALADHDFGPYGGFSFIKDSAVGTDPMINYIRGDSNNG